MRPRSILHAAAGQLLRQHRVGLGLSQRAYAALLSKYRGCLITGTMISRWETGRHRMSARYQQAIWRAWRYLRCLPPSPDATK